MSFEAFSCSCFTAESASWAGQPFVSINILTRESGVSEMDASVQRQRGVPAPARPISVIGAETQSDGSSTHSAGWAAPSVDFHVKAATDHRRSTSGRRRLSAMALKPGCFLFPHAIAALPRHCFVVGLGLRFSQCKVDSFRQARNGWIDDRQS